MPETWQSAGFGLYVHWPFCQAKCPYCDFNSHVSATIDQDRWRRAYLSEIARLRAETGARVLGSVYFGGGTPSLMRPDLVSAILETVSNAWTLANDIEITLEANPTSVEARRFAGYRDAGVNRVSIGIQALDDRDLRALGRLHTAAEAMAALDVARSLFDRVSFDLIYARQHQTLDQWVSELTAALRLAAGHLSLYQLTIEPGTAFGDRLRSGKLPGLPDDDLAADMFQATQQICASAGLPAYEISNHAVPGAQSRHNLTYWRGGDYAGIGPGAHGRLSLDGRRIATETHLSPAGWLRAVETAGSGESARAVLARREQTEELLMMGLRTAEGVDLSRCLAGGKPAYSRTALAELERLGMVALAGDRLVARDRGRPLLNAVLRKLLAA